MRLFEFAAFFSICQQLSADLCAHALNMWQFQTTSFYISSLLALSLLFIMIKGNQSESEFLFDFTTMDNVDDWYEVSDTVREVGKSKAALVLQKTRQFRRAVFFALLNPQPNGACFAGMYKDGPFDFSAYSGLEVKFKSQSRDISHWKILLKTPVSTDRFTSYEQKFEALENNFGFETAFLPFENFHQDVNGTVNPDEPPIDLADIKTFGLQTFGNVYDESFKQSGPGTLEIDYVKLLP